MLDEIKSAIEKNLPTQVGKVLQEELASGVVAKQQVANLTGSLQTAQKQVSELNIEVGLLRALQLKKDDLDKKERDYEVTKLKAELENQKLITTKIEDLVRLVVKNPTFTQYGSVPVIQSQPGGYSSVGSHPFNTKRDAIKARNEWIKNDTYRDA